MIINVYECINDHTGAILTFFIELLTIFICLDRFVNTFIYLANCYYCGKFMYFFRFVGIFEVLDLLRHNFGRGIQTCVISAAYKNTLF